MADSQAVFVGGGLAASPALTATDESLGRGVIVTSDDPAAVGGATSFGQDSTGHFWAQSSLTSAQSVINLQRAVLAGRALVQVGATVGAGTNAGVIIGYQAGVNVTGGSVMVDGIAIGHAAITDGNAVCIGASVTCNCNNGASDPVLINCRGVTGDLLTGVYIGTTTGGVVGATSGIFINGQCDAASGGVSTIIAGRCEGGAGMAIGGGGGSARITGASMAVGPSCVAGGPLFGTLYSDAIAIGISATATGTGAAGARRSLAIGLSAIATCDNATANAIAIGTSASATASGATGASVALGPAATAATGQCVIGATGFPMELRIIAAAAGERLRVDATATAGQTALMLYDVDNNTLERVTVGAADSGGVGFKLLRIPN